MEEMTEMDPWFEDDHLWDTLAPFLFSEDRLQNAVPEVEGLVVMLELAPDTHLLDLCCGIARHTLELARRGYRVTGVDRTERYLEEARKAAREEGLDIELVRDDIRHFVRPGAFDSVINCFTSFGYFEDPDDDRRVVENVRASLKPGGTFLIDMKGKEIVAQGFQERVWREIDDMILLEERRIIRNWSMIENRWIVLKGSERREFHFSHRLYSAVELTRLMIDCGFSRTRVYGGLSGEPYGPDSDRLVVVGYKS